MQRGSHAEREREIDRRHDNTMLWVGWAITLMSCMWSMLHETIMEKVDLIHSPPIMGLSVPYIFTSV